jgi:hypothetical protein
MIFPVIAGALRRRFVIGPPALFAPQRELFSNEMRDLHRNIGFCRVAGEMRFQAGTRGFGALEMLECYVTVRRPAAAGEFKLGPQVARRPKRLSES